MLVNVHQRHATLLKQYSPLKSVPVQTNKVTALLLMGPYATPEQANVARNKLSQNLQGNKPWVRPVYSVQDSAAALQLEP